MDVNVCAEVHPGPDHVPKIDKHTLPHLYKLGFNLIFPSIVFNLTSGAESDNCMEI